MTRPLPVIALYPKNSSNTTLQVQISANATVIAFRYIAGTTTTASITFVGKSLEAVVQEINQLSIPIKAVALSNIDNLAQGDLLQTGGSYSTIPSQFSLHDRITNNGIVIRANKFSIRHKNNSKISLLSPYTEDPSLPWYPRITNGSFSQKYQNKVYHFYIPEFDEQAWSTTYGKPFKDLRGIEPSIVDDNVYQLPRYPVYWNGENIIVYNGDFPITSNVVQDVDVNNGLLYLNPEFSLREGFTVDYSYLETTYVYKDININAHFNQNPFLIDKFVVIYLIPAEASTAVSKRVVHHSIGNSIEEAIGSISIDDPSIPIAIIGAYNIQQVFASDKISLLDTRSKGGGLKRMTGPVSPVHMLNDSIESTDVPIESLYPESYRFWDIGNIDGDPYPAAAAVTIDLPEELQEILSVSDIRKKASKFLAAGVYPSMSFSKRDLPSVTGLSSQVSCAFNLDLEHQFEKQTDIEGVASTFPSTYLGAGLNLESYDHPTSYLSGNWDSFDPVFNIQDSEGIKILEVGIDTGVYISYLKSTPKAGISWEERTKAVNSGSITAPIVYSNWTTKYFIDTKEVATGQLSKSYLFFNPEWTTKQYKNIVIHSPYHNGNLKQKLEDSISAIIDPILDLQQGTGTVTTAIKERYNTVGDFTDRSSFSDYVLTPSLYNHIFNLEGTPLGDTYFDDIDLIGTELLNQGIYQSGHYFKYYIQDSDIYLSVAAEQSPIAIEFNSQLKNLNRYLFSKRKRGEWDALCESGRSAVTGLVAKMISSSGTYGDFGPAIPISWVYYPVNTGLFRDVDSLSGYYISDVATVGTQYGEVDTSLNQDYSFNVSLPSVLSVAIANSGSDLGSTTLSNIVDAYNITIDSTINHIDDTINGTRYLNNIPTTSHWFIGHSKLGNYVGNNLFYIIEAYKYLYDYVNNKTHISSINASTGASPAFCSYIFSGIETILDKSYDLMYNNILRHGVVDSATALAIYGYGWYLNNWSKNYGLVSKTYVNDYREKFSTLFDFGLKQLIKNQITDDGQLLETKTVYSEAGSFSASTCSKLLYPLGEAVKYDLSWSGIAEGILTMLTENYSISGLYYSDPYKTTNAAGKENDVLGGLTSMYKAIFGTGEVWAWEPMATGLPNLRGCKFLPNFTSGSVSNTLSLWKYYNSGEVESSVQNLKSIGINTIDVPLDYILWKADSGQFFNKLDHLFEVCELNEVRIIPTILSDAGSTVVASGQESSYVTGFGHTGSYRYGPVTGVSFMEGVFSGRHYVSGLVARYDDSPALLAWSVVDSPRRVENNRHTYSAIAYIVDILTDTPIIYNLPMALSTFDTNGISVLEDVVSDYPIYAADPYYYMSPYASPRIDFVGASPNSISSYFIDVLPSSQKYILNNYGDGTYGDYQLAISRASSTGLPFILSDLYVKSGSPYGILYSGLSARISRQANAIVSIAEEQGSEATGSIYQVKNFNGLYFYHSGYVPSYTSVSLLNEIKNWSSRQVTTPLTSFNTGEFVRQIDLLNTVQDALDSVNSLYYTDLGITSQLSNTEMQVLNLYRTIWDSADFLTNTGNTWLTGGSIDNARYDQFITNWGINLGSICNRLNING